MRPPTEPFVRPYEPADREALRRVCFETGLMGGPVSHLYGDLDSFADMFCTWYLDHEPESVGVVDDGTGAAAGYLVGCVDTRRAARPERVMAAAALRRGLLFRPATAGFLWRSIGDIVAAGFDVEEHVDLRRYPAHLHIDLLPHVRGTGLGRVLMSNWLDRLRSLGVPGVHLGTMAENTSAVAFFESLGFRRNGRPRPTPGFRSPDGGRLHSILMVQNLTG
jgi:ribosomal protein S18 acetylase RimI-like enzyme